MKQYPNDYNSQQNQFSNLSDKKLLNPYKKSNLRSLLPPIQMPAMKRNIYAGQSSQSQQNSRREQQTNRYFFQILGKGFINSKKSQKQDHLLSIGKLCSIDSSSLKKYQKIAEILSYIYNESEKFEEGLENIEDSNAPKYKVYRQWELLQIQENYRDTNLGDFIIKIPNPDLLPKQLKQRYKDKDDSNCISLFGALENYDQLFNTQSQIDKNLQHWQKQAFQLCFYMMIKNNKKLSRSKDDTKKLQQDVLKYFIQPFEYFTKIYKLNLLEYLQLKKNLIFKNLQAIQPQQIIHKKKQFLEDNMQSFKYNRDQMTFQFNRYKIFIYDFLRIRLLKIKNTKRGKSTNINRQRTTRMEINNVRQENIYYHDKEYQNEFHIKYQDFVAILLQNIKSVSKLLYFYPEFTRNFIDEERNIWKRNLKREDRRYQGPTIPLHSGGYLNRVSHQGQLKWVLNRQKPADLLTLLRKFIIYKLTSRGGLFIRSFLSKQENHIFLVIKASEQHLQKMAQQSNFNMEVELGTIDIFSFEPVDKFGRPLRCNKYLREYGFIRKYNLQIDKQDRDKDLGAKSVQSQALNIYKKAIKMNQDQLRSKIILDQQQCDQHFSWLSHKLNIRYIQPDDILNNNHNEQQIQNDIWPIYYIYNKMIIESIRKLRQQYIMEKDNKFNIDALNNNIGLMLRLMFLKALNFCNDMYRDHRKKRFRFVRNFFIRKHPLQTIWNQMGEDIPRGYFPYFYQERLQRIWRKFEINQQKQRSKFTPAARLIITNRIIRQNLNISKSLMQNLITNYYPIHDPFILKNIKVRPYLNVLSSMIDQDGLEQVKKIESQEKKVKMSETFVEYQCQYTKQDFTKESLQQKLKFKMREMTQFSVNTIAFYCGEKLAFFFQFRRYLTEKAWPLFFVALIFQILFWIQNSDIQTYGTSSLTLFNNAIMIIMVIINTLWTERTVNGWQQRQKKLARSFGTNDMNQKSESQKRVLFEGQMKRNMQTNQINDEYQSKFFTIIKQLISLFINLIFIIIMAATILIIFTLKGQLYQRGYVQSTVTILPSFLIALATQIFSFVYSKIIGLLVQFQNKKTIHQYQSSLTSKSFIVTFVITYFVLFIYGFFQQYFDGDTVCAVKTTSGIQVTNCYYYISGQLVISAILDLILTIFMAFYPLILFYITRYKSQKHENNNVSFNLNYFQSIDCFYQQQDRMQTYMYTDQIDKTWQGYTAIVISYTTLVLFAPIVPFLYIMMFFNGVVSLNAKKYEIIYFSKRILPLKTKSIGVWRDLIRIVSVLGVFVNVALIVYVRNLVTDNKAVVLFSCVFVILVIKYLMSFGSTDQDIVGKRCKCRTQELINQKMYMSFNLKNDNINTDIQNLYYDQRKLRRQLPKLPAANIKHK